MSEDVITIAGVDQSKISDGYHTFGELYEHRIQLFLALCRYVSRFGTAPVWRSWKHSDGSQLEGWFVMGIFMRPGLQITYHLPKDCWQAADFALTVSRAPEYDGHSSAEVLERLKKL